MTLNVEKRATIKVFLTKISRFTAAGYRGKQWHGGDILVCMCRTSGVRIPQMIKDARKIASDTLKWYNIFVTKYLQRRKTNV